MLCARKLNMNSHFRTVGPNIPVDRHRVIPRVLFAQELPRRSIELLGGEVPYSTHTNTGDGGKD